MKSGADPALVNQAPAGLGRSGFGQGEVERVAELQLAAFLAGRASGRDPDGKPCPTLNDFRNMARAALTKARGEA